MRPTQKIYWHTTVQMPDDSNLAPIPEKVDVAVIGGGYTGLSAARTLAKQGVRVAVLEANTIGWGASSRNGGMVLTGLKVGMQSIMKRYGRDVAKQLFQCSLDSIDTVEQIVREENIDCGFARYGHLLTANKPKHFDALKENDECSGGLNPAQYVVGLAEAAQRAGATLHSRARVNKLERRPNRFILETERG